MRKEGVSSVLVRGDALGIVTDRDLTTRDHADGLGPETLVSAVASRPLRTLPAETPVYEAWGSLLESGAHHVPVTRGGELLGVLSANDLLEACAPGPMAVLREVERLASRDALPGYAARVAEMDSALLAGGLDATAVGELVSRLDDALRARVIFLAQSDLGPAPAPFAWLAFGAEARRERTLLTERDDGLAFADRGLEREAYYYALAERVDHDLEAAGFPRRQRGVRRPFASLGEWTMRVNACIDERRPHEAAFLFDLRKVWGTLDVAPLEIAVGRAQKNPAFLRHLARAAIDHRPPGSLGLRLRGDASVDLDAQGISLVVSLARCYGLEVGAQARGTLERLEAAAEAGLISDDAHESVAEAYRFLQGLKLRQGLRMISEGRTPVSTVRLHDLSAIERSRLKDAFRAIARWQERAAYHYRTDFF
jgi:CBS domain-containing protein